MHAHGGIVYVAVDGAPYLVAVTMTETIDPLVMRLRAWLDANLTDARVSGAAHALGMSVRGLQRALAARGTAFHRELDAVRVAFAKARLATSDCTVAAIAADVGCASPQHLAALFRRQVGMTPSAFRLAAAAAATAAA